MISTNNEPSVRTIAIWRPAASVSEEESTMYDLERYEIEPHLLESGIDRNFKWLNLRRHSKETEDNRFCTKSGWLTLTSLDNRTSSSHSFMFPLYSSEVYMIGKEPDNDFVLPLEDDLSRFLIRVDCAKFPRTNKSNCSFCGPMIYSNIIIENVSSPVAAGKFLVNGYQLNVNTKICIIGCCFHADIEFDSNTLSLARSIAPNFDFNSIIVDSVQCPRCKRLLQNRRPLPCGHVFCLRCIKVLSKKASVKVASYLERTQEIDQNTLKEISNVYCPLCKLAEVAVEGIPFYQIIKIPSFSVLNSIETVIPELISTDLFCDDCDNVRCVASRNDYWQCTGCNCVTCPLCAIELHRHHLIRNYYFIMIASANKYKSKKYKIVEKYRIKKCQVNELVNQIKMMRNLLNLHSVQLRNSNDAIDRIVQLAKTECSKLKLRDLIDAQETEKEREERRQIFEAIVITSQQNLDPLIEQLDMKVAIVCNVEAEIAFGPIEADPEE